MRLALAALLAAGAAPAQEFQIGAAVPGLTLQSTNGAAETIPLRGKTSVVLFVSTQCPVSKRYSQRMIDLYNVYAPLGVQFIFINSNATESGQEVAEHARTAGFPFAVHKDPNNTLADRFGAQFTPETYVIDAGGILRYHGRIDDAQNPARVTHSSLKLAIDAVRAGRDVETPETRAFGCTIRRAPKTT